MSRRILGVGGSVYGGRPRIVSPPPPVTRVPYQNAADARRARREERDVRRTMIKGVAQSVEAAKAELAARELPRLSRAAVDPARAKQSPGG